MELADLLNKNGFDCDIDQYHSNQSWPTWMEERVEWADRVVVICSETYLNRWKRNEKPGVGLGGKWESFLIKQDLYEGDALNEKFIPVVFRPSDATFIPKPLRDVTRVIVGEDLLGFVTLKNRLLGIAPAQRPPISTSLSTVPPTLQDAKLTDYDLELGLYEDEENLHTNLFPVSYPDKIYQVKIKERNIGKFVRGFCELWKLLGNNSPAPSNFYCEDGMIYSFNNFHAEIWRTLEKEREIFPQGVINSDSWAQSKKHANKNRFIKLLNRSLQYLCENNGTKFQISRSEKMKCYLFAVRGDQREGKIHTKAIKVSAPRTVYKAIMSKDAPGEIQHWKHTAFRHKFVRFDQIWYLVLTPFWAFTSDGLSEPSRWQRKASANMQKPEKNRSVLGHVAFWASVLCKNEDLLNSKELFQLRKPDVLRSSPSIRDDEWLKIADAMDKSEFEEEECKLI